MEKELLKLSEVQKILDLSRPKIYEMASAGELPIIRIGKSIRVPRRALTQWIEKNTIGCSEAKQ